MSAEQVPQMLQVLNQTEQLRQKSVADIVAGYNLMSEIDLRERTGDLTALQADKLRILAPRLAEEQAVEIAEKEARAGLLAAQGATLREAAPYDRAKLAADTLRAQAEAADIPGRTDIARRGISLQERQYAETHVPMPFKLESGEVVTRSVAIPDIKAALREGAIIDRDTEEKIYARSRQAAEDARKVQQDYNKELHESRVAEKEVAANPNAAAAIGHIDEFNAKSDKTYFYRWDPRYTSKNIRKVPLLQYRVRDVVKKARALNMEPYEFIQKYIYGGKTPTDLPAGK